MAAITIIILLSLKTHTITEKKQDIKDPAEEYKYTESQITYDYSPETEVSDLKELTKNESRETTEKTSSVYSDTIVSNSTGKEVHQNGNDTDILNDFLNVSGYTTDDSSQIITVTSSGSTCQVNFFSKNKDSWELKRNTAGIVGKNGVSENSTEGDNCTPKGKFSLGFAFGTENITELSIPYRQINNNCYWVDDPESPLYNKWVETDSISWNSAEHLSDYPVSYKYGIVIEYNTDPIIKNKGSAIFFHCMDGEYTAGCVAVPENDMLYILQNIDSAKKPCIMII